MNKSRSGFTIVELLIVIVVIAILAAISVVAYNGIQERTRANIIQSDLANAKKSLMLYKVDSGNFPKNLTELNSNIRVNATKSVYDTTAHNFYYCYNLNTDQFAIGARSIANKNSYMITSSGNIQSSGSPAYGDGTCQSIGLTGYADTNGFISNGHGSGTGWVNWTGA